MKKKQQTKATHKKVLAFIKAVRYSFHDASIIYTHGGCYGFHQIMRQVFPFAIPYMTGDTSHVVTRINGRFYDIRGEFITTEGKLPEKVLRMNTQQKEYWEGVANGQRVEYIIKKYNKD